MGKVEALLVLGLGLVGAVVLFSLGSASSGPLAVEADRLGLSRPIWADPARPQLGPYRTDPGTGTGSRQPSYYGSPYRAGFGVAGGSNDPGDVVRDSLQGRRYGRV